jgi:NADH:ubiquinone oxidoreductase subunit 4 (subunit M)
MGIYLLENRAEALSENRKFSPDFKNEDWILVTEIADHCPTSKAADLSQTYEKGENYIEFFKGIELGFLLILLSLFFKLALAPFYLWAPDIYEGAPSSTTFFFLVISKFSLFVFLVRLCYSGFYGLMHY